MREWTIQSIHYQIVTHRIGRRRGTVLLPGSISRHKQSHIFSKCRISRLDGTMDESPHMCWLRIHEINGLWIAKTIGGNWRNQGCVLDLMQFNAPILFWILNFSVDATSDKLITPQPPPRRHNPFNRPAPVSASSRPAPPPPSNVIKLDVEKRKYAICHNAVGFDSLIFVLL